MQPEFGCLRLKDYGELRLLEEVILPIAREFDADTTAGDDCAIVGVDGSALAVTTDYGPRPLVCSLPGYEDDFEAWGWLAAVVSASDVAASGARPVCMTNCIEARSDFRIGDLASYVRGYFSACAEFGFRNGGGDLRCGSNLGIRVAAIGACSRGGGVGRGGIEEGDRLVVIGPTGCFMATYLLAAEYVDAGAGANGRLDADMERVLRFPRPRLREMAALAEAGVVVAASDTSDGLLGAIENLSRSSGCGFELVLKESLLPAEVKEAGGRGALNPWNIFFAWGDWSVAAAVRVEELERFRAICREKEIAYTELGSATGATGRVVARIDGEPPAEVRLVRNENFAPAGFNEGVTGHLNYLLKTSLFDSR